AAAGSSIWCWARSDATPLTRPSKTRAGLSPRPRGEAGAAGQLATLRRIGVLLRIGVLRRSGNRPRLAPTGGGEAAASGARRRVRGNRCPAAQTPTHSPQPSPPHGGGEGER